MLVSFTGSIGLLPAADPNFAPDDLAFFESKIRPLLVDRCYECHSAESRKLKGGLRLDSRAGLLVGGDTGPALTPGQPAVSLLIEAVRYENVDFQMPPKDKLSDREIADLEEWVRRGAPWTPGTAARAGSPNPAEAFDLEKRFESHWAWRPPVRRQPPSPAGGAAGPTHPIDAFIQERLFAHQLTPAPRAPARVLLRRATFDLWGLPPTPADLASFEADDSTDAFARAVDRLLDSPHFGERWARHWLDLVRYAETLGHEFDYTIHDAWRYRDYVIRAFNQDLPYDRFVLEHVAGDLLPDPRYDPATGHNESIVATGFYWLGQQTHSPVDVKAHEVEIIENQIDVLSKTFLGMTVACARCHDHKFDAVPTRDFYALYGMMGSSRHVVRAIDSPRQQEATRHALSESRRQVMRAWLAGVDEAPATLAHRLLTATRMITSGEVSADDSHSPLETAWMKALNSPDLSSPGHPLHAWWRLTLKDPNRNEGQSNESWIEWVRSLRTKAHQIEQECASYTPILDWHHGAPQGWFLSGQAFELSGTSDLLISTTEPASVRFLEENWLHSGLLSRRLQGALRSPTFEITNRFLHVRVCGSEARFNVVIDHYNLIRDPIYGSLKRAIDNPSPHWITVDLAMWQGHRAYVEFIDQTVPDPADTLRGGGYDAYGYAAVSQVLFSERNDPPVDATEADQLEALALDEHAAPSWANLAQAYADWFREALACQHTGENPGSAARPWASLKLLNWLAQNALIPLPEESAREVNQAMAEFRRQSQSVPMPTMVTAMMDGNGYDEYVFIRGNHKAPGDVAIREIPEALRRVPGLEEGCVAANETSRSGRLELARTLVAPMNPLTARVMANRIWQHLMGRGLVGTPDDFGVLGERPTHPELLDWLAQRFQDDGWSVKRMIRLIMTSQAYQMSSRPENASAEERDPKNTWYHRMNAKRMEGEVIRDAILAVSGRLDGAMFGPPVAVHLTPFMDGRGRPGRSGPLDGDGRRSVYGEVRRNFLSPMMLAYDVPVPFSTVGKRSSSNVPAQALIMMNDPFMAQQAERWATRILSQPASTPEHRVRSMYESALGRLPDSDETSRVTTFLENQRALYRGQADAAQVERRVWADFAQVIFNMKEFVIVY